MIYITLDITGYNEKPDKKEIAKINQRLKTGLHGISNLYALAETVGDGGCTWCPAVFEGARKIDNFKSIQIIALDFDGGVTFDEISKRSKKYMIPILFAYETFSSWNADKFRIAILLEEKITKKEEFDTIIKMLMKIFPECDKSCKDVSRMFFGGKRLMYYNYDEVSLDKKTLAMNFALYMKNTYGSKHYKERIRSMFKTGANLPGIVYNKTTNGENAPNGHRAYRQDILSKLCNTCRLYNEFINDNEWLYYNQLYGLATNLIHIETGSKCFLNTVQNSQFETYKRDWKFYLKYFKDNEYLPMRCENFCPYHDSCPHAANMLCTAKIKRKEILRLEAPEYSDISEVQAELKEAFYTAMDSCDKRIHVIKAQTAIGKTHLYLEYLKNTDKPCIIAVPTNKLKNEVYKECITNGIDVMETPSIYEFEADIPKESFQYINKLYSTGNHTKVMQYIKSKSDSIPAFKSFISATEATKNFEGHIITTHHKVLYSSEEWLRKYDLIIDEDILKTMTKNQITIEIADIEELLDTGIPKKVREHLNNIINTADEETLFTVAPLGDCNVEADFNLNALLNAKKFYSDGKVIIFYQTPELKNLKYTVLSATADEYIYKQYFGEERVSFYTCKTAPYKGKLLQYVDHSYSRRYISNHDTVYEDIEQLIGNVPTITFKKYSDEADGIHFGNSEGCNCMKGQDIAVIGTPHVARFLYILLAYQMGYDGSRDEQRYQEVTYNGYKFWFYTFSNELLQRIHFWMVESELEQSVGRARLLREDCTVWLFSDFPLRQSEVVTVDDEKVKAG